MAKLRISPYTLEDNKAALYLEEQCVQGKSLVLKYRRPTFHARSEVYDKYRILCAKVGNKLVGVNAWAEKCVYLYGKRIRAAYLYDLRVLPAYRKQGVAIRLMNAVFDDIGQEIDCIYTLIAGQNERALKLAQKHLGLKPVISLTYIVIPVYKKMKLEGSYRTTNAGEIHRMFLEINNKLELVPQFDEKKLLGYVTSIIAEQTMSAGCSIWTNENLLAEQVVAVPRYFNMMRVLNAPLRFLLKLPCIPKPNEIIRSWFLFDLYARNKNMLRNLLAAVSNSALKENRKYIYILLQNNDILFAVIKKLGLRIFTLPYFFLAKGSMIPTETEKIYIDIRDV